MSAVADVLQRASGSWVAKAAALRAVMIRALMICAVATLLAPIPTAAAPWQIGMAIAGQDGAQSATASESSQPQSPPAQSPQPDVSFREILSQHGVDASQLSRLIGGQPFSPLFEREPLERTLAALRNVPRRMVSKFTQPSAALDQILQQPADSRGEAVAIHGRVTECGTLSVTPELQERLGFDTIYHCRVQMTGAWAPMTCDVFSLEVPQTWLAQSQAARNGGRPLSETTSFDGVFLKFATPPGDDETPHLVFAAKRVAWFPDSFLGRQGFDVSWLHQVRLTGKLVSEDAPAFHGLLAMVGNAELDSLANAAAAAALKHQLANAAVLDSSKLALRGMITQAANWQGDVVTLEGTARRAVRIVADEEVADEFGFDSYYEIEVFIDGPFRLPNIPNSLSRYPVTFCTTELPSGIPQGEQISLPVRVTGVFLKNWQYRSALYAEHEAGLQTAPLIVGGPIEIVPATADETPANWGGSELALTGAVLLILILLGLYFARTSRRDRAARSRRAAVLQGDAPKDLPGAE